MANLSNINNKFLVTTGGNVLIGQTAAVGTSVLQAEGSTNAIIRMNSTAGTGGRMDFAHSGGNYGNVGSARNMLGVGNATDMMVNGDNILYLGVGAQHMTILSSGNVGIGVTDPDEKLVLYKSLNYASDSALYSAYAVNSTAVDNNKVFKWKTGITGNQSGHNLTFSTLARAESSYVERMRIKSDGVITFSKTANTTTPDASINHASNDFVYFTGGAGGASFGDNGHGTRMIAFNSDYLRFDTGDTGEKMRIVPAGAVGIDNSSPDSFSGSGSTSSSLVIGKGTSGISPQLTLWQGNSAQATINFASANTGTGQYEGRIRYTRDTGIMDFRTNNIANVLVLNASGGVGIGTTNPSGKLEVNGNNYNTNSLTTFTLRDLGNNYSDGDNSIDIVMRSRYWSGDANTSQNSKIRHLKDNSNGSTGTMLQFGTTTEGSGDASTKMTIKANGNVGIGINSPNTKLDVSGTTGTRNRNTQGSSVYETSLYFNAAGNATTNVSIDTRTAFPPIAGGGFILVEVSASGYGNSGSNGLVFSYISGGYGGHYGGQGQPYHPVEIIANTMQAGSCTFYYPNWYTVGIAITTTNSAGLNGLMRVKVTTTY
jgi:hypothetical protein